jgi:hypothetical protein
MAALLTAAGTGPSVLVAAPPVRRPLPAEPEPPRSSVITPRGRIDGVLPEMLPETLRRPGIHQARSARTQDADVARWNAQVDAKKAARRARRAAR